MSSVSRRQLMLAVGAVGTFSSTSALRAIAQPTSHNDLVGTVWEPTRVGSPTMRDPVWVYDNWSAYTDGYYKEHHQLPDDTRLSESLAMEQMKEIARLQHVGVCFDYYMMNAFWFDPDGAYRKWRQPDWPAGPDRWIDACHKVGVKPGLWFGTNKLWKINLAPQWQNSIAVRNPGERQSMVLYEGGFLPDFMAILQHWYDRGIRMFEFDAANFDAATSRAIETLSAEEIRARNQQAFTQALREFRSRNSDAMLVAFNGFGGDIFSTATPFPFKKPVDLRWLEVFDTLYCGDIRVSDVPHVNFWRAVDLFNDHMVRRYEQSAIPLERIDPFFTLSTTWFGYKREKQAWKSMLLLTVARGSWKKTVYGDLSVLNNEEARWFAKVQTMYAPLIAMGRTKTFGGIPGEMKPYGFGSFIPSGAIYTVVNPTQQVQSIELPRLSKVQRITTEGRILFRDSGYRPTLNKASIQLGPGQMSVVGFGQYALREYDLGIEYDVVIPKAIRPLRATFSTKGTNAIVSSVEAPPEGDLRVIIWQRASDNSAPRSPYLKIVAEQKGRPLTVSQPNQERAVSTGISWAAGEIRGSEIDRRTPVTIRCSSPEKEAVALSGEIYAVEYGAS